jgi:hypothetical protein
MDRLFQWLLASFLCVAAWVGSATAAAVTQEGLVELRATRPATAEEEIWLEVHTGQLPPGSKVRIMTPDGRLLGSTASYGSSRAQGPLTYKVPLPATVIAAGVVRLRLQVQEPGVIARIATARDVESVDLIYVPTSR